MEYEFYSPLCHQVSLGTQADHVTLLCSGFGCVIKKALK